VSRASVAVLVACCLASAAVAAPPVDVRVEPKRVPVAADVGDRLVSFAVDVDQLVGGTFWDPAGGPTQVELAPYDFGRPRLRGLARALAPAYLRLGGSASDETYYDLSEAPPPSAPAPYKEVLARAQWDGAMAFARDLGLEVIATLNAGPGPRDAGGAWTDANARRLLEYAASRRDPVAVLEWGNEPNLFALRAGVPSYRAADYARDFAVFRALRDAVLPSARVAAPGTIYTRTLDDNVVANIAFGPRLRDLLPLVGPATDLVTYHYYAAISSRCPSLVKVTPETALDGDYLDGIAEPIAAVAALRDQHAAGTPIWNMESGGQSCGGQVGLGDRFLNSFWYLNTLGRMARAGQEVFVRQTLSGSTYGLVDDVTLAPRPDYWAALLWRRLMGRRALALDPRGIDPAVRLFAHCQRDGRPGAVTVLALNTSRDRGARLRIRGVGASRPAELHLVTAPAADARHVLLNRRPLDAAADGTPPAFRPRRVRGPISLPPLSYAFVVLPRAGAAACRP
jgi:hypothetical protein